MSPANRIAAAIFGSFFLLAAPHPAGSAEPADQRLQSLIEELEAELARGEKDRLIDPWFLRDLKALVGRYSWPWQKHILSEEFDGKDSKPPAPWTVTAGEFLVDWRLGLRSVVKPKPAPAAGQGGDPMKQLLGEVLKQTLGGQKQPQQAADPGFAAVTAPVDFANAFALAVTASFKPVEGQSGGGFEVGPYQEQAASAGYRLAYRRGAAGAKPILELVSLSSSGATATIELYDGALPLEDGASHKLEWTRDKDGLMRVALDGAALMEVTDRRFRDPFNGLLIINSGGDLALDRVVLDAAE